MGNRPPLVGGGRRAGKSNHWPPPDSAWGCRRHGDWPSLSLSLSHLHPAQHPAPRGGRTSPRMGKLQPREGPFAGQRAREQSPGFPVTEAQPVGSHPPELTEHRGSTQAGAGGDPGPGSERGQKGRCGGTVGHPVSAAPRAAHQMTTVGGRR